MSRTALRLAGCVAACASIVVAVAVPASAATAAPRVTSVSPAAGPVGGGLTVTVGGSGFGVSGSHASVKFGSAAGTSVHVLSSTKLQVTAPKHGASQIYIRVTTAAGTSASSTASAFTYVSAPAISSVTPSVSPPGGGRSVIVRGYHFTAAAKVRFGATYATNVHVISATEMQVLVPAHPAADVGVRVYDAGGVSDSQPFTYRDLPQPVTDLSAVDETSTTVTLGWLGSTSPEVTGVVVRRATGSTPPATPTSGMQVGFLPATTTRFVDNGLAGTTRYSYSVFAQSPGPLYSSPAGLTVSTPDNSHPDTPSRIALQPAPIGASSTSCDGTGYVVADQVAFTARVSDPDGDNVSTRVELVDLGADGQSRTVVLSYDDPAGQSASEPSPYAASVLYETSSLIDGDLYSFRAIADDGQSRSASSSPCVFRYNPSAFPTPTVSSTEFPAAGSPSPAHVGDHGYFFVRARANSTDPVIDHFVYSFTSPSSMTRLAGLYTYGGGEISANVEYTASQVGAGHLYVAAVDEDGNQSSTTTYNFDVVS